MEATPVYAVQPRLNFSSVFKRSFSTVFQNPVTFLALAAITTVPGTLAEVFMDSGPLKVVSLIVFRYFLNLVGMAAICHAACQALDDDYVSASDSLQAGFSRLLPLIGASLLLLLLLVAGFAMFFRLLQLSRFFAVGIVLLMVPGAIVTCMLVVTVPACVMEYLGPIASMNRSAELTKGNRWPIFVAIFLVGLCAVAVGAGVGGLGGAIIGFAMGGVSVPPATLVRIVSIILLVVTIPVTAICSSLPAVIYHDLCAIEQGSVGLAAAAQVFD